jgi:adenylate cyclase
VVLIGTVIGVAYGSLKGFASQGAPGLGGMIGAIHGSTIAITIGLIEIFATRTRLGRALEQAPLVVTVLIKGLVYVAVIAGVTAGEFGARVLGVRPGQPPLQSPFSLLSGVFSLVFIGGFIFVLQISRIVGSRTLRDLVLGRYHRPRSEQRFFLFVDVVGSTGLAERVGPLAVHRFLNRVFSLAADPVADYHGEIYQYVGDEMVVTWTVTVGRVEARPVACFFAIEETLTAAAREFERDFGTMPRLRARLHAGTVITGEIGESKREIVFHGDVMNTASRLEQATRALACQFLVSEEARSLLLGADQYAFRALGLQALRGRVTPVQVHAITRKP